MPLKLEDPRPGKSPFYRVRGTHRGVFVDISTKARGREEARKVLERERDRIDRDFFSGKPQPHPIAEKQFFDAWADYHAAGGSDENADRLLEAIGHFRLSDLTQEAIDAAARQLFPDATAATRNRWFYTPVSAVLKHAGIDRTIRRPKGWRGKPKTEWLSQDQATRLLEAAGADDPEFRLMLLTMLYTGMRLSEALGATLDRTNIAEGWIFLPQTKNARPRMVHLPPVVVAALACHPRGLERPGNEKLFRFVKCGRLYTRWRRVVKAAGPDCEAATFHTLRHTWATWMRRYGGLDTAGLVGTGAWIDRTSAARYEHVVATEEARRADLLPDVTGANSAGRIRGKSVEKRRRKA